MQWSNQKQFNYGSVFFIILVVLFAVPIYFYFLNNPETCSDGKLNQTETGIDCGGVCTRACTVDVIENPIVLWSRAFPIVNGKYNLVAYLQNPNINHVSEPFNYIFNAFDEFNVLIESRTGIVNAPYDKNFVAFEQVFDAGKRKINKVTFEITSKIAWTKVVEQKPKFGIYSNEVVIIGGTPTLTSVITNKTAQAYRNFYVVAIIYDVEGNAMAVSRTLVDELPASGRTTILFTWPYLTDLKYSKIEILPRI